MLEAAGPDDGGHGEGDDGPGEQQHRRDREGHGGADLGAAFGDAVQQHVEVGVEPRIVGAAALRVDDPFAQRGEGVDGDGARQRVRVVGLQLAGAGERVQGAPVDVERVADAAGAAPVGFPAVAGLDDADDGEGGRRSGRDVPLEVGVVAGAAERDGVAGVQAEPVGGAPGQHGVAGAHQAPAGHDADVLADAFAEQHGAELAGGCLGNLGRLGGELRGEDGGVAGGVEPAAGEVLERVGHAAAT